MMATPMDSDKENSREHTDVNQKANMEVEDNSPRKKESRLHKDEMKFMKDFDPNHRLIKKKMTKFTEVGAVVEKCDCLKPECVGCHMPCQICNSRLCGHECRVGRSWDYREVELQGYPTVITLRSTD